jgi:nitrite reductase/ring-hydroxylating ferredoxin subunit
MDTTIPDQALCRLDDIPEGGAIAVDAVLRDGEENLIVLRRPDGVRAYMNICPHAGRRLDWAPGKFLIKDHLLICAAHGASFNDDDGLCVGGPCRGEHLRAVPVRLEDESVYLAE